MVGARANGKMVPIDYVIQNGDRIEIITSQNSKGPSRDWLNIVKSTQAKNKINQWFKTELKEDNIIRGKELLDKYCKAKGITQSDILKPEYIEIIMKKYGFRDWDSVLAALGHGGLKEGQIINRLLEEFDKKRKKEITDSEVLEAISQNKEKNTKVRVAKSKSGIIVKGIHDISVHFSKCCNPVPGDEIVGFVTRGRGVSLHRTDCINIINLPESERVRLIEAEWQETYDEGSEVYVTEIKIYANNRTGMVGDISKILTEKKIDIKGLNCKVNKQEIATIVMSFETHGKEELNHIIDKLKNIEGVIDIERATG